MEGKSPHPIQAPLFQSVSWPVKGIALSPGPKDRPNLGCPGSPGQWKVAPCQASERARHCQAPQFFVCKHCFASSLGAVKSHFYFSFSSPESLLKRTRTFLPWFKVEASPDWDDSATPGQVGSCLASSQIPTEECSWHTIFSPRFTSTFWL